MGLIDHNNFIRFNFLGIDDDMVCCAGPRRRVGAKVGEDGG